MNSEFLEGIGIIATVLFGVTIIASFILNLVFIGQMHNLDKESWKCTQSVIVDGVPQCNELKRINKNG